MKKRFLRSSTVLVSSSLLGTFLPGGVSNAFPWESAFAYAYFSISFIFLLRTCCSRRPGLRFGRTTKDVRTYLDSIGIPNTEKVEVRKVLEDCKESFKRIVPWFGEFFDLSYDEKRSIYKGKLKFLGKEMFDVKLSRVTVPLKNLEYSVILEIGENFKAEVYGFPETFVKDLCRALKSVETLVKTKKFDLDIVNFKRDSGNKVVSIELTPKKGFTIKSGEKLVEKICFVLKDDVFGSEGFCIFGEDRSRTFTCNLFSGGRVNEELISFFYKINEGIEKSNNSNTVRLEEVFVV